MRVELTTGAQRNLDAIEWYISQNNPAAAKTILEIIKRAYSQLSKHLSSGKPGRIDGTRELIFTEFPYIVIYTVRQDVIFIVSVFHNSQNLEHLSTP